MRSIGELYEKKACDYLVSKGYEILEKNYCIRGAEIDIIAKKDDTIVFIEVKARISSKSQEPLEAITEAKKKRLGKAALIYMRGKSIDVDSVRFDAIGISSSGKEEVIEHVENAFCPDGYFI